MTASRTPTGSVPVPLTRRSSAPPPEPAPGPGLGPLPPSGERPGVTEHPGFGPSQIAGLVATGAVHLVIVLALALGSRSEAKPKHRPPKEMIIKTQILEVQAGSREGTREKGPAYKRRKRSARRSKRKRHRLILGTSGRRAPRHRRSRQSAAPVDDGKDDAADVPSDFGSTEGVDAPPGATPADDRKGAGGTADKGALDPCFTQHDQVVAGYRAKVARKIPRMKRPAFVSAAVAENLATVVRVAIDASGRIVRVTVAHASGNPRFDAAATAHVQAVGSFPAPHKCVMYDKVTAHFRNTVTFAVTVKAR